MSDKNEEFRKIVDIVVECSAIEFQNREELKEKVLSSCREEPIVIMRCMLARLLAFAGFTNSTIGIVLHRSPQSIRHLLDLARDLRSHNKVYRIAEDEAVREYQEYESK